MKLFLALASALTLAACAPPTDPMLVKACGADWGNIRAGMPEVTLICTNRGYHYNLLTSTGQGKVYDMFLASVDGRKLQRVYVINGTVVDWEAY